MDIPEFIDTDIIHSPGFWLLTAGAWIAFLLGFKGADTGLFGLSSSGDAFQIDPIIKILIMLLTPVMAYLVSMKFLR